MSSHALSGYLHVSFSPFSYTLSNRISTGVRAVSRSCVVAGRPGMEGVAVSLPQPLRPRAAGVTRSALRDIEYRLRTILGKEEPPFSFC